MRLSAFVPTNTQKARTTAIAAFERMLEQENVSMEFVQASILQDNSGKRLAAIMDGFGFYLAANDGKKGGHYIVNVAGLLYHESRRTARVHADYQDAALACLMWHCFGRSSDLGYIQKAHVGVRGRHALAVAVATQIAPTAALLNQLPKLVSQETKSLAPGTPLLAMLEVEAASFQVAVMPTDAAPATGTSAQVSVANSKHSGRTSDVKRGEDGVQAYANRMLKRIAEPAGTTTDLTSHSFRRGGAQHANSDDHLAAQWIFDRGAWDITTTYKAFAHITNTAREDRKVARVLSGWGVDAMPVVLDIATLYHSSQERLRQLQALLFGSCMCLKQQNLNVSTKVLNVLLAYLIRHYPQMKELAPALPIITRVEDCLALVEIPLSDVVA
ncbi:hypothetical protein PHMEG_00017915 [Phytophthora megakarya]|uniref:Uncharacterized protein n=1 Tax=Phytophthora megakarya TaxID=4795 RepID=A0A225VWV8_9STRA|nr:hypothetical protein PHMEG_00017915 [Phytophthora megakarya]